MESNFYTYIAAEKKYVCNICGKKFCQQASSVRRHCITAHKIDFKNEKRQNSSEEENIEPNAKKSKPSTIEVHFNKNQFIKSCVSLVAVRNIPFRVFDDEDFKILISPYEKLFGLTMNSKNIVQYVGVASSKINAILRGRLQNKLLSIKVDIATKIDMNIIGINVQYIRNFKICINTLGMIQLRSKHMGQYIKNHIISCLGDFGIGLHQIYTNTTDNGANLLKASRILQELQKESMAESSIDMDTSDLDDDENIHDNLSVVMSVVRCAAHTIQLAAQDVIKTFQPNINVCRNAVKKIRKAIRTADSVHKLPVLDSVTKWNSTFDMLSALQNVKEFIQEQVFEEEYDLIDWEFVEQFTLTFKPLAICTTKLQAEQYIVGDFYRDWWLCEIDLQEIILETPMAEPLLDAMRSRKEILLQNDAFLAAIYMDPRFNFKSSVVLTQQQKLSAVNHLVKTFDKITQLEMGSPNDANIELQSSGCSMVDERDDQPSTSLQKLDVLMVETTATANISDTPPNFKDKLLSFCDGKKSILTSNILDYWKSHNDNDLKKVAEVVLAVPPTQVSVERSFSALTLILTKLRSRINDTTINNMLLTKLNYKLIRPNNVKLD